MSGKVRIAFFVFFLSCVSAMQGGMINRADSVHRLPGVKEAMSVDRFYELPEVVVEHKKRQVLYMQGYMREYSMQTTVSDTVFLFREKMIDFMIPAKKAKGFKGWTRPRVLSAKSYYHFSDWEGLDSVSDYYGKHFSLTDRIGIMSRTLLPEGLRSGASESDTVMGHYGPVAIWHREGDEVTLSVDLLADTVGMTYGSGLRSYFDGRENFMRFTIQYAFADVAGGEVMADNIVGVSVDIETGSGDRWGLASGRMSQAVSTYAEIYITDKRYISVSDARRLEKRVDLAAEGGISIPAFAPELQASVRDIVGRVNSIDHDQLKRTSKANRKWYMAVEFPGHEERKKGGLKRFLKTALKKKPKSKY